MLNSARKILILFLLFFFTSVLAHASEKSKLTVFYSPYCHRCSELKVTLIPDIEREFKGLIGIEYSDTTDLNNYKFLIGLRDKYDPQLNLQLPIFYINGALCNGVGPVKDNLRKIVIASLINPSVTDNHPVADLVSNFKKIVPLGIFIAGLEDGINPCAFTVIVFFISFLSLQGYRRRELLLIGSAFILAVFLTYLLLGLGIFGFLYQLKGFWVVTKAINLGIGILSIFLGMAAIYDFIKLKRGASSEELALQLPQTIKNRIHGLIGFYYRKDKNKEEIANRPSVARLIISALVTGFLVSLLEALCTGQVYLPTIVFVFKTTPLKLQAFLYLLMYNILFIVPLGVIFLLALLGTTAGDFSRFLKKHLAAIKIAMALLFFSLGAFLIWRA